MVNENFSIGLTAYIAHEYGHAIRAHFISKPISEAQDEYWADVFAGYIIGCMQRDTLLGATDIQKVKHAMEQIGDPA